MNQFSVQSAISDRVRAIPDDATLWKSVRPRGDGRRTRRLTGGEHSRSRQIPIAVWERLRAQVLAKKGVNLLRYSSNRGDVDLRKAIAAYLCDFEQRAVTRIRSSSWRVCSRRC